MFFVTFLRVCLNLIPRGTSQQSAITTVFKKCCEHGQVDDKIFDIMVRSIPEEQLEIILGQDSSKGSFSIDRIPEGWKCNVEDMANKSRRR